MTWEGLTPPYSTIVADPPQSVAFTVVGLAETQGSKTPMHRGGKTWLIDGSPKKAKRHKGWREAVADAARDALGDQPLIAEVPVAVRLSFWLPKPASAPKRRRVWPIKARSGDVDKLARSVLDSLTHTVLADDSQVVALVVTKDFDVRPRVDVALMVVPDWTDRVSVHWEFDGRAA